MAAHAARSDVVVHLGDGPPAVRKLHQGVVMDTIPKVSLGGTHMRAAILI